MDYTIRIFWNIFHIGVLW